jgi:Cutinase
MSSTAEICGRNRVTDETSWAAANVAACRGCRDGLRCAVDRAGELTRRRLSSHRRFGDVLPRCAGGVRARHRRGARCRQSRRGVCRLGSLVGQRQVGGRLRRRVSGLLRFSARDRRVNDASTFIENAAQACPRTKMVLGGYSQGAAVVDVLAATGRPILGFSSPLPDTIADHIAAVVVFGNPSNRIGEPLTTLSPLYGSKAVDLCNGVDPVCSDGNDVPAHSLYVEAGMADQAAQFVVARLNGAQTTQLVASRS